MAMNPIQFQRGLSLLEFMRRYGSEAACERALREARWPRGLGLPAVRGDGAQHVRAPRPDVLAVQRLPPSD